jgi:transaldolase/glucose-6-phosphate isomerase
MHLENPVRARADRLDGHFALWAGPLSPRVNDVLDRFASQGTLEAIYAQSPAVWAPDVATQTKIANRLGWLSSPDWVLPHLPRISAFAASVQRRGMTDVVLLGMGGSSLAPEVLRSVIGVTPGWPRFHMLDSTDPAAVLAVEHTITLASTLFLLASKSGGTVEPNSMAAYFRHRLEAQGTARWADQFVAITDEGTALHQRATTEGFSDVFVNRTDIGGRYSALSFFGLVPAALMGQDIEAIVGWARAMLWVCSPGRRLSTNPAVLLGAAMGTGALAGRDKLTLVLPAELETFGLWVEQLVAESTGKQGQGVVPVSGEALGPPAVYGTDRVFVALDAETSGAPNQHAELRVLASAGAPWAEMTLPEPEAIGAEFVRWELATAVAGVVLGVNPFDEPNVQQAKDATRRLLDSRAGTGPVPRPEGGTRIGSATVWMSAAARSEMGSRPPTAFLDLLGAHDYLAILAYLGPDPGLLQPLAALRHRVREKTRCATTLGYGPRYLHSTGQLHKGGDRNGAFLIVLAGTRADIPVPGESFTFGELEHAQALGDFASLEAAGRRAIAVELASQSAADVAALCEALAPVAR